MAYPKRNPIPWNMIHQKKIHPTQPLHRAKNDPSPASSTAAKQTLQPSRIPIPILYSTIHKVNGRLLTRPPTRRIKLPDINQFPSNIAKEAWQAYIEENDPACIERSIALDRARSLEVVGYCEYVGRVK